MGAINDFDMDTDNEQTESDEEPGIFYKSYSKP